jgi:hypothetical protein
VRAHGIQEIAPGALPEGTVAMKVVGMVAVVLAILGGAFALLGHASVVRDAGGSDAALGYLWLLITGLLAVMAVLSHPRDVLPRERTCPSCGRQAEEDWTLCPMCGTRLPQGDLEGAVELADGNLAEEGEVADGYEPGSGLVGNGLFWLGIAVLDALFVLLLLWLFAPSLVPSQKIFWSLGLGGTLGIVMLDFAIGSIFVGYSVIGRS